MPSKIIQTTPGSAQVSKSYSSFYYFGMVYTNGSWKTKVTTHYRETNTHEYGSYASTTGYTRT